MLAAGEPVFLRAEAEAMLAKEGYEVGTPAYAREFTRRYMPLNTFHTTVMESHYAFLSPKEHAEVADAISHASFFDHYDTCRVHWTKHETALTQAREEFMAVYQVSQDPRFYADYLKRRVTEKMSHSNALDAVVVEWFTRPS